MNDRRETPGSVPYIAPEDLALLPTLATGQAADLKHETEVGGQRFRYWINRVGRSDGAEHAVEIEHYHERDRAWRHIGGYGEPDE